MARRGADQDGERKVVGDEVTGGCDVARIEALARAGVTPSRNRHYALWSQPGNRRLLTLWRFVATLARELVARQAAGELSLALEEPGEDGRWWLVMALPSLAAARRVPLTPAELGFLARQEGVTEVFAAHGLTLRG